MPSALVKRPRRRLGWIDLLVVTATSLTFAATVYSQQQHRPPGPPTEEAVQAIATELGVTAEDLRRAAGQVPPPPRGVRLTALERAEHHRALAAALSIPVSRLNAAMEKYGPPPQRFY
jgi:hypothetical protein